MDGWGRLGIGPDDIGTIMGAHSERLTQNIQNTEIWVCLKHVFFFPHDHMFDQEMMLVIASCWILGISL